MPDPIECPVPACGGHVRTKRLEMFGVVMFCDAEAQHSDTVIRNAFARWDEELDAADPDATDALLRKINPVEFIRDQIVASGERRLGRVKPPSQAVLVPPPSYPTGLVGVQSDRLTHYRGMTLLSGKASSGKTWSALRASVDAARTGWDVVYVAAEAVALVNERVQEIAGSAGIPEASWSLRVVEDGTRFESFVEFLADCIRSERTLFVLDSFSTLLRMLDDDSDHWHQHRRLERLLFNVRQLTAGCVGLLVISEANAAGETKGRSFDHIADLSVNFAKDADDPEIKVVTVAKSWWGRIGEAGRYVVRPSQGGLVRLPDEGMSVADQSAHGYREASWEDRM